MLGTCGAMMTETHLGLCHGFEHGLNLLMEIGHQHLLQGLYLVQSIGQKLEAFQHQGPLLHQQVTAGGFQIMVRYAGQIFVFQWLSHLELIWSLQFFSQPTHQCTVAHPRRETLQRRDISLTKCQGVPWSLATWNRRKKSSSIIDLQQQLPWKLGAADP